MHFTVVSVLSLVACASDEAPAPDAPEMIDSAGATLELGTGVAAYSPIAENGDVELVFGSQGGWHIDVAARFTGLDPDAIDLEYELILDGADSPVNYPARYALTARRVTFVDDHYVRLGDRLVLDIEQPGEVVGHAGQLQVRALVASADRVLAAAVRHVSFVDQVD